MVADVPADVPSAGPQRVRRECRSIVGFAGERGWPQLRSPALSAGCCGGRRTCVSSVTAPGMPCALRPADGCLACHRRSVRSPHAASGGGCRCRLPPYTRREERAGAPSVPRRSRRLTGRAPLPAAILDLFHKNFQVFRQFLPHQRPNCPSIGQFAAAAVRPTIGRWAWVEGTLRSGVGSGAEMSPAHRLALLLGRPAASAGQPPGVKWGTDLRPGGTPPSAVRLPKPVWRFLGKSPG